MTGKPRQSAVPSVIREPIAPNKTVTRDLTVSFMTIQDHEGGAALVVFLRAARGVFKCVCRPLHRRELPFDRLVILFPGIIETCRHRIRKDVFGGCFDARDDRRGDICR